MQKVVVMSYYHYLLHNNPEDHSSHLLHGRSLKSHLESYCLDWSLFFCIIHVILGYYWTEQLNYTFEYSLVT